MAAEVSADLTVIHDEDVLRRMWQQTDDFGRKKEIRQRMYKLREQRLKDFYTGDDSLSITTMASRKHAAPTHADSISDQGFMALKSKEVRDSESPTRDIHRRQGDKNYWNTVQESSYTTQGEDGGVRQSYERTSTGNNQSEDGRTQTKLEADERGFTCSKTTESDRGRTVADEQHHDAQMATSSHTKTDNGEAYNYSTSQEHHESKSSVTEGKDQSAAFKSTKWETSSVSSSSSKKVFSSSNHRQITSDADLKALTSGDDEMDFTTTRFLQDDDYNTSTIRRGKNVSQGSKRQHTSEVRYTTEDQTDSSAFIDKETRNNIKNNLKDIQVDIQEDHFGKNDSRRGSSSTYTTEVSSNVDDYITNNTQNNTSRNVTRQTKTDDRNNVVVDQKIMSEIHKLDSFLSTQNTPGTTTPVSPHSVMGEVNWTVVSNNDGEFVYRDERSPSSPGSRSTPIKHPDNLDLPKECTEGQYVTTYNEHYTTKRVSMDVSPTHDAFARSLRQTPPGTPRSLSRQSLDRSSPERKSKNSPRSSPDKERRTSVGSYTVEKPTNVRRKTSEVTRQTTTSKDSAVKSKRKFSTTQTKAAAKARNSTPGTSPSTSPSRKQKERSGSPSSASDSDASQVTYDKKSTTSTYTRSDVVRRNLMDTFDKESPKKPFTSTETITKSSSRPSSPEKSPTRKSPNDSDKKPTGILRKDSRSDSKSTIVTESSNVSEYKVNSTIASRVRDKSPEYSSEGSVSKEIKNTQRKSSPDSSPERSAFTPIKQFRTSPEMSADTMKVTATETDQSSVIKMTESFINQENVSNQNTNETVQVDIYVTKGPEAPEKCKPNKRSSSPEKETPEMKISSPQKSPKQRAPSPTKTRSQSPLKNEVNITRKESFSRKTSSPREKSPSKVDELSRAQSPTKSARKPSLPDRSPAPNKNDRSISPTKGVSRKPSLPARSPSPPKERISKSPSPPKKESVTTTTTTKTVVTRRSSYDAPTETSSRKSTPSPVKDHPSSRSPSPKKESPVRRTSSPTNSKSPSPQRGNKRSRQQSTSPSVSPCSSPERTTDRKSERTKVIRKTSGSKTVDTATVRTTRRSSIPRADQSTVVRKTVETKIEIRAKPNSRIPSSTSKTRIGQSPINRNVITDSQTSLDRQTTTKSTYSTTINRTMDKSKEPVKKVTPVKKTVTTTAVISLQKPNPTSQTKQPISSTTAPRATTYKRTSSKEITPKKGDTTQERKSMVTTTTKRVASRTNTPKTKPSHNYDEVDRLTKQTDGIENVETFIEQLRKDEVSVHGYKDETINLEIEDNDLENETRPDLFPETEDDEENPEKQDEDSVEPTQHISEKTINVDSKRKVASQFMVTIKKPTTATPSKVGAKPITTRSSSGPVKGSPQTIKTSQQRQSSTVTSKRQITTSVQKADSLSMIRTTSDKNVAKSSTQRRQMSKPEMSTAKPNQQSPNTTSSKPVAETGIASKNINTPKSATIKRVAPNKKKSESPVSPSSEDEDDKIPSVVTPNHQEQQYIEELEEMRRNEEMEYAAKLTATTNQENQLLSVIVQHPKSSRESSPDFSNRPQPYCTVSDDGGATPRYADLVSEPEDVEVFDPTHKPKFENYSQKQPKVEQITDLDEESEVEDFKLNVSVADRARHFIEASQNHAAAPVREEPETPVDSSKNVLKAKTMFETIANNQKAPPAPGNKPVDILCRPSVFEARRGQTAPNPLPSDDFTRDAPGDQIQRRESIQIDSTEQEYVEEIEENRYEKTPVPMNKGTSRRSPSPSPVRESPTVADKKPDSQRPSTTEKPHLIKQAPVKQPTPKADPTSRTTKVEPTSDRKKPDTVYKPKPFEKTISATAEISSKRAFFERKAQAQNSPVKESKTFVPLKERKPLTDYIQNKENIRGSSPPRKTSQTTTFIENERKSSRVSPERKVSTPSPVKERKSSLKSESPERRISITRSVKERRSSFTKEDEAITQTSTLQKKDSFSKATERKISPARSSPERRAPITEKNFPDHSSRGIQKDVSLEKMPSSPVKDRKPSFTRESPERVSPRKSSRSSPERSAKSPDRASPSPKAEKEPAELNKAGKFGVTLRRTSSTTSAGTPRRLSIPGESQEIEDVSDVELLEIMMEKAVGYDQRRRIRAQIRVAKKAQETQTQPRGTRQKSPTRSPTRDYKATPELVSKAPTEAKKVEPRRPSSPTKSVSAETKRTTTTTTTTESVRRPSPERVSPGAGPRAGSPQRKESVPEQRSPGYKKPTPTDSFRRTSKTDVEVTSSVRSGKAGAGVTLVETGVDSITSSYGVGPTDENGRPLFGLRALRRTNTNKQLTDEVTVAEVKREEVPSLSQEPVCDTRGRPLFGGLKALRTATATTTTTTTTSSATTVDREEDVDDMPEQTGSAQLRELVQRHEKVVRETNGPQDQPRQKPKARLRDSFILQEEDQTGAGQLNNNSLGRGVSLKSLIQKHETIATNGVTGGVRSEMESSRTVVTSRSHVASDGSVSVTRDVVQGELSAKNGEEPVGKVTRTQYSYQNAGGDDKGVSRVTTTTTPLGRRTSGPSITEVEDAPAQRKSSLKSTKRTSVTEEVSGRRSVETVRKGSLRRSPSEDEDSPRRNERVSHQTDEEEIQKVTSSRVSSTAQKISSSDDKSKSRFSSTTTRQTETRTKTASPGLRRQKSSEEESSGEEKRKAIVRGDSVRALQHKFQQATVSSTLKQSTGLSADKKGRQESTVSEVSSRRGSQDSRRDSLSKNSSDITSRRESVTKDKDGSTTTRVTETSTSSFLDNTSRVTGVQDILTRMRNADLVSESGDTEADREARALLNKFLGASVILQGMEQGMRAGATPDGTPGSAALVRTVEKQRVATTRQKEEDIENIWDEQVLKTLLEQCTDYEGRRTLRARLRTVMAEHKACADLVALTGDNASQHAETETKQVTMSNEGGSVTRTEVTTRTSTNRLTKANSVSSPFAKFRQLERQNSAPSVGQAGAPLFKITDPRVARSASSIKDRLLSWVQAQTQEYKNIQIDNFSTSWNNGLAFCALIHHFCPNAFDYDKLTPEQRRHNFELAFRVAEEEAGIAPLLDVEDMVVMRRPDWKCVFTYVQSVYRRFHSTPEAVRC